MSVLPHIPTIEPTAVVCRQTIVTTLCIDIYDHRPIPDGSTVSDCLLLFATFKKYILRTDQPTDITFGRNSNGHISARGHPIHFIFGSTMRFAGSADRMALFPVSPIPRWRLGRHLGKFKWRYLSGGSSDLLRVWF